MNTIIVHFSDIHFRENWHENHNVVFQALFDDLAKQIELKPTSNYYAIFSGDIVQAGEKAESYSEFSKIFDKKLNELGIDRSKRICVPGNHDVSRSTILKSIFDHEGIVAQNLSENDFNNYARSHNDVFRNKFDNYIQFQNEFTEINPFGESICGGGFDLDDNISVYCLNTAFFLAEESHIQAMERYLIVKGF